MADTSDATVRATLQLALTPGVGGVLFRALLERFGSAEAALAASEAELASVPGFGPKRSADVARARDAVDVDAELSRAADCGVRVIVWGADDYPVPLTYLVSPPLVLYVRGSLLPTDARAMAIVGSRRSSLYGQQQAERFAASLSGAGMTVVSGLARGIDICAHMGAVKTGGRTIAVLGNGLSRVYPPEHERHAAKIVENGALLSEFPMDAQPAAENFPRRNRIISGMSLGVLVVEAGRRSGAMITATTAAEQGKDVFALPGRVDTPFTTGTHKLIQEGAKLAHSPADILDEYPDLGLMGADVQTEQGQGSMPLAAQLDPQEEAILGALEADSLTPDQIAERTGLAAAAVAAQLTMLEIKHLVQALPGRRYARLKR